MMKKNISILTFSLFSLGALFISGCKQEGCTDTDACNYDEKADEDDGTCDYDCKHAHPVITFSHTVGGEPLIFDSLLYQNTAGNQYSIQTLIYFISDLTFHLADGSTETIDDLFYIEGEDNTTFSFESDIELSYAEYDKITFVFGLDSITNANTTITTTPELNMEWPAMMGGGYHYMKLEGKYDSSGTTMNYNTHYGPSGGGDYSVNVELSSSSFTVDSESLSIEITMDINNWYNDPIYDFEVYGEAIMSNTDAQSDLQQNGDDVFSVSIE